MKFDDILFVAQTGASIASSVNPVAGLAAEAGVRLMKLAHDAYVSGRERGEWTANEVKKFDEEILPMITSQPHWKKSDQ